MSPTRTDDIVHRVRALSLKLPESSAVPSGRHISFTVRKKTFAYYLDDHHGDGIVGLACKVLPGDNTALINADPARFYMPAYIGSRGWIGVRLDSGKVDWDEIAELVQHSYLLVAPKKLAHAVDPQNTPPPRAKQPSR